MHGYLTCALDNVSLKLKRAQNIRPKNEVNMTKKQDQKMQEV